MGVGESPAVSQPGSPPAILLRKQNLGDTAEITPSRVQTEARRVRTITPTRAGLNSRNTARYEGKNCGPLHNLFRNAGLSAALNVLAPDFRQV
jgi:hypothetical protein